MICNIWGGYFPALRPQGSSDTPRRVRVVHPHACESRPSPPPRAAARARLFRVRGERRRRRFHVGWCGRRNQERAGGPRRSHEHGAAPARPARGRQLRGAGRRHGGARHRSRGGGRTGRPRAGRSGDDVWLGWELPERSGDARCDRDRRPRRGLHGLRAGPARARLPSGLARRPEDLRRLHRYRG